MPGLNQLKRFSEDVKNLGDEINIRAERGEKPNVVPFPQGISEADDSQDFVLGLPVKEDDAAASATVVRDENAVPSLDELMNDTSANVPSGSVADLPDLSEFMDDVELPETAEPSAPEEAAPADAALADLPPLDEEPIEPVETVPEVPTELDATDAAPADEVPVADAPAADDATAADSFSMFNLDGIDDIPDIPHDATDLADLAGMTGLPSFDDIQDNTDVDLSDVPDLATMDKLDAAPTAPAAAPEPPAEEPAPEAAPALDASPTADATPATDDSASLDLPPLDDMAGLSFDEPAPAAAPAGASDNDFAFDGNVIDMNEGLSDVALEKPVAAPASDDLASLDSLSADAAQPVDEAPSAPSDAAPASDGGLEDFSVPDFGAGDSFSMPDASGDSFEIPDFAASDASAGATDSGDMLSNIANEFPPTGESAPDDFELDSDFEIPGFSDTDTADTRKKQTSGADSSKGAKDKPRNTLTEEEYEQFKKNFATYPLNVRVIVEDFISKDEFTDDAVFEVIEKILKKVPARQLAGHLEKMLDITIDVPRNYEHRSVAEYEAYKQSFQYQLRNRILPFTLLGIVLFFVGLSLIWAGKQFIYKPAMASMLYKQGYTLLENNEYPQSELKFARAVTYKPVKKWFFKYARGYRDHKQYERAAQTYRSILARFKHDKTAGLEYATMELYDRANYPRAEEIVRREILDYHINDKDGLLLLGDIFLEWADVDNEKYESAREQYASLIQLYGGTDLYMSRMMRYFIRTDNLRNVLELKNRFYINKNKKKGLGADDWTELSGYLLDKLYGKLDKSDEYLRSSIEDVLDMLETALKLAPENPVAHYNLARYFLENGNFVIAQSQMKVALDLFEKSDIRNKRNTYREINAARILGELYIKDDEYLQAQAAYTRGINAFNAENARSGIEGNAETGLLFADMGDIDYFIVGDMDSALFNYETAIRFKQDTPSLHYRVGAINYGKQDYTAALAAFIKTAEAAPSDPNLLLALGNTLSLRGDNYAAEGYYADLITRLNNERARSGMLFPHESSDDNKLVDLYVKANNNLGVTLYRLAQQTGDSSKNAEAVVRLSDSMRAWDALTRNPQTMLRLPGSNLAAQNSKYITHVTSDYEPAIYTDIARVLSGDQELK